MRKIAITPEQACNLSESEQVEYDKLIDSINDNLSKSYTKGGKVIIAINAKSEKVREKVIFSFSNAGWKVEKSNISEGYYYDFSAGK